MLPNLAIMLIERGFSKRLALPHVLIWTPLVLLVAWVVFVTGVLIEEPTGAQTEYFRMLLVLLVVDLISLGFDFPDAVKWWRGDRGIA